MLRPPLGRLYQNVINLDVICQRPGDGKSSQGSYYSWWTVIQSGWCKLFRTIWSERSRVKRYGVIFTYLASCEVHLDFAASLTSMHCTVLSQVEDKLRGFALTTLLMPNVSLPDPNKNGTISNSVSDATEKTWQVFSGIVGFASTCPFFKSNIRRNKLVTLCILWISMLQEVPGGLQLCTKQGLARQVKVKTATNILVRHVNKWCLNLEMD